MKKLLFALAMVLLLCTFAQAADLTLQWQANTETDLAGYRVYYGNAPGTYSQALGSGINVPLAADENSDPTLVEYTLRGLPKALTYFVVTAYDNEIQVNESGYSNEVSTNFGPSAPSGVKVKVIIEVTVP